MGEPLLMDNTQKVLQIADDLDEQASQIDVFVSDPTIDKTDRIDAANKQVALRQQAAHIRVELMVKIVTKEGPDLDEIVAACDRAKAVARKINNIKSAIGLATAALAFFGALASGNVALVVSSWTFLKEATEASNT